MDTQDIQHLAHLARLSVDEKEIEQLKIDFTAILAYIDQLKEVAEDGGESLYMVTNQMREDVVVPEADVDALLEQMPQRHDRYTKVQKIISTSDE